MARTKQVVIVPSPIDIDSVEKSLAEKLVTAKGKKGGKPPKDDSGIPRKEPGRPRVTPRPKPLPPWRREQLGGYDNRGKGKKGK